MDTNFAKILELGGARLRRIVFAAVPAHPAALAFSFVAARRSIVCHRRLAQMDPALFHAHLIDFLSMMLRWLHMIAGIAWIGASFYFIWLDNSLDAPEPDSEEAKKGVAGELWAVHGGGFYNPQKYAVAPAKLPEKLHWFKWEAYTTWLSGTALLIVFYWLNAGAMMLDPDVSATLTPWQAVGIGAASMVGSWIVYDLLCRSPLGRRDALLGLVVFGFFVGLAGWLSTELSGRAMFIHVGAAIGTIMAANVFFVIIPGQRKMVAAMRAGQRPDAQDGRRAKQRSVHNNYFTLPVLFMMISNHYASTYTHPHNWAVLMLLGVAGLTIRHFFNLRHKGIYAWQYPACGVVLLGAMSWWTAPHIQPLPPVEGVVDYNRVRAIIGERCVTCHSPIPSFPGYAAPPAGVVLAETGKIRPNVQRIYQRVVINRSMPIGNLTHMTEEERAVIAAWIKNGAPLQ